LCLGGNNRRERWGPEKRSAGWSRRRKGAKRHVKSNSGFGWIGERFAAEEHGTDPGTREAPGGMGIGGQDDTVETRKTFEKQGGNSRGGGKNMGGRHKDPLERRNNGGWIKDDDKKGKKPCRCTLGRTTMSRKEKRQKRPRKSTCPKGTLNHPKKETNQTGNHIVAGGGARRKVPPTKVHPYKKIGKVNDEEREQEKTGLDRPTQRTGSNKKGPACALEKKGAGD